MRENFPNLKTFETTCKNRWFQKVLRVLGLEDDRC